MNVRRYNQMLKKKNCYPNTPNIFPCVGGTISLLDDGASYSVTLLGEHKCKIKKIKNKRNTGSCGEPYSSTFWLDIAQRERKKEKKNENWFVKRYLHLPSCQDRLTNKLSPSSPRPPTSSWMHANSSSWPSRQILITNNVRTCRPQWYIYITVTNIFAFLFYFFSHISDNSY